MLYELLIKLSLSLVLGLLIGIDRQMKHKPLGLRTSMVICVASCLLTIVSIEHISRSGLIFHNTNNVDPMRLAAQIVSGIGFLGAGVILRRNNDVISGLTTAAMIWAASGLGIAIGAGFYFESFFAVILILIAVNVIPIMFRWVGPASLRHRDVGVKMVLTEQANIANVIEAINQTSDATKTFRKRKDRVDIRNLKMKDLEANKQQLQFTLSIPSHQYSVEFFYKLKAIPSVDSVELGDL
ncbi:MgtC/SapB family protein [Halalkalibacterium halodurans]|uniref:Mg2+-transporting ATPase n=3 Tax=Halalkalibacterium halodurans TaxID=86665 RepID=Q9KFE0_HALH5|nr:MgtC/SapB family protein [Halalkalibacterium halodurans]MDY7221037.1 MgtC/SapB family protein [Halalkalibacterium halodurans]MDY7240276.1 MgtC/SapB family protein [Halalkalibacterium halodurans]MED4079926.1 MgtC/SapB family protein [Halalkalibacterium halodurans]MED4086691.1 MgtC/SapB family protein [Halalkalibacterium halodurans]MED4103761.1 MgtC/SapB family protein [Halalkalibacterium halodurans]